MGDKNDISLTVEATNELRLRLGLKPLVLSKSAVDNPTDNNRAHSTSISVGAQVNPGKRTKRLFNDILATGEGLLSNNGSSTARVPLKDWLESHRTVKKPNHGTPVEPAVNNPNRESIRDRSDSSDSDSDEKSYTEDGDDKATEAGLSRCDFF